MNDGPSPGWWLPQDASLHGLGLDRHMVLNLWIALTLLVFLHLLLFAGLALRRRASIKRSWAASFEYIPLLSITLLFIFLTVRSERLWAAIRYTGADRSAMQVEATGVQFVWYFRYPGKNAAFGRTRPELIAPAEGSPLGIDPDDVKGSDDFISSELVLPVGREVDVRLHAQDVIHGFAVPEMRIKQNAIPGQDYHVHFTPTRAGAYAIMCTQLCGLGHFRMNATMRVLSPEDYGKWLAEHEQAVTP